MKKFSVKVELSTAKPVKEVFEAFTNPVPFFVHATSGPLREGEDVNWKFAGDPKGFLVHVTKVIPNKLIWFEWPTPEGGANTIEATFTPFKAGVTTIAISESGWPPTEKGRAASYLNCSGWMHMACCLKAHLEFGSNLRKGPFIHMNMG